MLPALFTACMGAGDDYSDDGARDNAQEEMSDFEALMTEKFQESELPYTCNVNFDNFDPQESDYLSQKEFELLELYMIFPEGYVENRYSAIDKIELENGIKLVIIAEELGDHELSTYLMTYTKQEIYISNVRLAYDEIAEGFLQIDSKIEGDKITRTTTITLDEVIKQKEHYFILDDGQIIWEEDLQEESM